MEAIEIESVLQEEIEERVAEFSRRRKVLRGYAPGRTQEETPPAEPPKTTN